MIINYNVPLKSKNLVKMFFHNTYSKNVASEGREAKNFFFIIWETHINKSFLSSD